MIDALKIDTAGEMYLVNCRIIDVKTGTVTRESTIRIRNGMIDRIEPGIVEPGKGMAVFDCHNRYVMPGLINGHCHLTIPPAQFLKSVRNVFDLLKQMKKNFSLNIEKGITTVRDMGGYPGLLSMFIKSAERGGIKGPRVIRSNSFLSVKGGYIEIDESTLHPLGSLATGIIGAGKLSTKVKNIGELREKMGRNIKDAGLIKVSSMDKKSLIAGKNDTLPAFSDEELYYIFNVAEKNNLPVALHNLTADAFRRALKFPFNSFEHIVSDEYLGDSEIKSMKRNNMAIVPTMVLHNLYALESAFPSLPQEFQNEFIENEIKIRNDYWNTITNMDVLPSVHETNVAAASWFRKFDYNYEKMYASKKLTINPRMFFNGLIYGVKNLLKMRDAGVLIGCGTDSGVPWNYHGTLWREMEMLSRIGFANAEIIQCATLNNAKILGAEQNIGSLETGKLADIIVLKENPLNDIKTFRNPLLVFLGGKLVSQNCVLRKGINGMEIVN